MNKNLYYKIERPIYSCEDLRNVFDECDTSFNLFKSIKYKMKLRKPTFKSAMMHVFPFPFIMAQFYKATFLLFDLIAGITMLVFHIPQGMAYGLLAGLQPINGLYASFFPPLIYILFGTSRHLSLGTFSIMALLSSVPVIREGNITLQNITNELGNSSSSIDSQFEMAKLEISIVTTILAGFLQLGMGLCRLGNVMTFINDALIGGFTSATAFHVVISQLRNILGYSIPSYSGNGELPYKLYLFLSRIMRIHWITFIISISCIVILLLFTEVINPRLQKKLKFPLPVQLVLIILTTVLSYYFSFNKAFKVKIVGPIPKGLPQPMVPNILIGHRVIMDAILLALVSFVINSSLVKIYALKFSYDVDYNQELVAYGLGNIFGSFFQCTISGGALARSAVVVQAGMKSQLASLVSCFLMLFVLLFIGPLFENVPTCVLSTIIVVSLKGMIMQLSTLPQLYKVSKYDFDIWVVAFVATMLLNVPYGLVVGFVFSVMTVVIRLQNPKSQILGQLPGTNIYPNIKSFQQAKELPGIKLFRFDAPLYFANAEYLRKKLYQKSGLDPTKVQDSDTMLNLEGNDHEIECDQLQLDIINTNGELVETKTSMISNNKDIINKLKFIIIDCSSMNYLDNVAIRVLGEMYTSYKKIGVCLLLAGPNRKVREMLKNGDFAQENRDRILFVTVHDAVLSTYLDTNNDKIE